MSDISIPGVSASKYKTDELIQGLMKAERIPRDRADKELTAYKNEQTAWRDLNKHTTNLRDASKLLYSYNNPFSEKTATSTNENAITANVTRDAREQSFKVSVTQTAQADSFLSSPISIKGTVPKGDYAFSVGDKNFSFAWKGGSYKEFVEAINKRSNNLVRASLIQISQEQTSFLIESQKTGENNRLLFGKDALNFALDIGLVKKTSSSKITSSAESYTARPESAGSIDFSSTVQAKDDLKLSFTISIISKETSKTETDTMLPKALNSGSITYNNISISNAESEQYTNDPQPRTQKAAVHDMNVLSLKTSRGISIPLPALEEASEPTEIIIPLSSYGDVSALLINNKNTDKEIVLSNISIVDPKRTGDVSPSNPVSTAQDAIMKYEGITIKRNSNTIDDLIPGVTLNLYDSTTKTETIQVKPDTEHAKEAIISFVGNYNRVMAELNILTQGKDEIITEIQYFTDDETKKAEANLGLLLGDTTLTGLKNTLQRITSSSYRANDYSLVTLLSQLGISTKSQAGGAVEFSKLRGYLEIDEKKLDEALSKNIEEVKNLFGFDSDGDLVVDSGLSHSIDKTLTPYVQTGGIFTTRTSGLASKITTTEKKIAQLDVQLEKKEAELKSKYGQMEGTLNSLQNQSNTITNFSNQNNKN